MRSQGFTIIELLIASAITLLLLGIATQGIQWGGTTTRLTQDRKVALEDLRSAGNYIADQLSQAYFVYPPGSVINLSSTNPTFNYTLPANPLTVSSASIAAILPPVDNTATCSTTIQTGCLRFFAVYTIPRSTVLTAQQSGTFPVAAKINNDSSNTADNVLMVYWAWVQNASGPQPFTWITRDFKYPITTTSPATPQDTLNNLTVYAPTSNTNVYGSLLADYLSPTNGFSVTYSNCLIPSTTNTSTSVGTCPSTTSTSTLTPLNSIVQLGFTLNSQIARGSSSTTVIPLTFQTASRNLILKPQQ
jgi:prepilin-type N-terminal cleavage/methylation domain-containing protein